MDEVLVPITQSDLYSGILGYSLCPSTLYPIQHEQQETHYEFRIIQRDAICPRIHGQSFDELPFEEEILDFIRFLRHSATIRTLTDEDFVYQVEHKNHKKRNEMYHPRFIKVIIHYFMSKDPSIPRRNKVNWHYVKDDFMFLTIKVVSRQQNTQQYCAMLPIELTNDEIRNTKEYNEYYAFATGEAVPKPKASARRKRNGFDTFITPPTVAVTSKLTAATKGKQPSKAIKAKSPSVPSEPGGSGTDEGTGSKPGVPDVPTDELEEELSWNSSDDEGVDDQEKVGDDDEGDEGCGVYGYMGGNDEDLLMRWLRNEDKNDLWDMLKIALYERKCRLLVLWAEIRESRLIGLKLMQETTDKVVLIKEKLKAARDRQKSYVDNRSKPLELRLGIKRPFEILKRIGPVAYRLRFPKEMSSVHDTFHVSILEKCLADANLHVPLYEIKIDKTLCFVEEHIEIMDREDINQIDEDDMKEMDIKWNMALLSMKAYKAPRSQDRGRRDNFRQGSKAEEQAPKALMDIDGVGWD
nr:putative reverse transcriptase domain-containing protein [Tanacetum cinerariifolium]